MDSHSSHTKFLLTAYNRGANVPSLRDVSSIGRVVNSYGATVVADPGDSTRDVIKLEYTYLMLGGVNEDLAFGVNDFCIEFGVYLSAHRVQVVFDFRPTSLNGWYPYIDLSSSGVVGYYLNGAYRIQSASALALNQWHHVAVSRASGTTRLWIDGVQSGPDFVDATQLLCGVSRPVIGTNGTSVGANTLSALIRDFRITNGSARYTQAFTPVSKLIEHEIIITNDVSSTTISGTAIKQNGNAIDSIDVLDLSAGCVIRSVSPDENGHWSTAVDSGVYFVLYRADGCAPICHGPYTITV